VSRRSATPRQLAIRQAVAAWRAHRPHEALTILADAGFTREERDMFLREGFRAARVTARRRGVAR